MVWHPLKLQRWNGTDRFSKDKKTRDLRAKEVIPCPSRLESCCLRWTWWQSEGEGFGFRNYVLQLSGLMKAGLVQRQLHPPAVAGVFSMFAVAKKTRRKSCKAGWVGSNMIFPTPWRGRKWVTPFQSKSSLSSKMPPAKPPKPAYVSRFHRLGPWHCAVRLGMEVPSSFLSLFAFMMSILKNKAENQIGNCKTYLHPTKAPRATTNHPLTQTKWWGESSGQKCPKTPTRKNINGKEETLNNNIKS